MSSEPVRMGYVGCGFVAQRLHIPNFTAQPQCQMLALAEVRQELGQAVAKRYGIPKLYKTHLELAADPDIEAVGVSAPYSLQGPIAEDLIKAGKHVFMEKPMAVSLKTGRRIVETVKQSGKQLMVAYMKRYDTGNLLLKKHLDQWRASGECGNILLARNHGFGGNWVYAQDPNVPFEKSAETPPPAPADCPDWLPERWHNPYLGYLQQWTHNINLLRFLLGDNEDKTRVATVQLSEDGMTGLVVLDVGGVRAVVESGYTKFHGWEEHTQIYFQGGYLRTAAPPLMAKEVPATVEVYRAGKDGVPPRLTSEFAAPTWSYREEARHFLECVRSGAPVHSSAQDTLTDVRLFEDIYRQFLGK